MKTTIKKFPIYAAMQFAGGATKTVKNSLHVVGYKKVQFLYKVYPDGDEVLLTEQEISRKFF